MRNPLTRLKHEAWWWWERRKPLSPWRWHLGEQDREFLVGRLRDDFELRFVAELDLDQVAKVAPELAGEYVRTPVRLMSTPGAPTESTALSQAALRLAVPELWATHKAIARAMDAHPEDVKLDVAELELDERLEEARRARESHRLS